MPGPGQCHRLGEGQLARGLPWAKFTAHHQNEAEADADADADADAAKEFIRAMAAELDRERRTIMKDDPQPPRDVGADAAEPEGLRGRGGSAAAENL